MMRPSPIGELLRSRIELTPRGRMALTVDVAFWRLVTRGGFPAEMRQMESESGERAEDVFAQLGAGRWAPTDRGRAQLAAIAFRRGLRQAAKLRGGPSLPPAADRAADAECGAPRAISGGRRS